MPDTHRVLSRASAIVRSLEGTQDPRFTLQECTSRRGTRRTGRRCQGRRVCGPSTRTFAIRALYPEDGWLAGCVRRRAAVPFALHRSTGRDRGQITLRGIRAPALPLARCLRRRPKPPPARARQWRPVSVRRWHRIRGQALVVFEGLRLGWAGGMPRRRESAFSLSSLDRSVSCPGMGNFLLLPYHRLGLASFRHIWVWNWSGIMTWETTGGDEYVARGIEQCEEQRRPLIAAGGAWPANDIQAFCETHHRDAV